MHKIPPMGARTIAFLIGLFMLDLALFVAGKLLIKQQPLLFPPEKVDTWQRQPANPPIGDEQRDSPLEASEKYDSGDNTVTAHFARVLSLNALRAPERYLVDSDGRVDPIKDVVFLKYNNRPAFTLCYIQGINQDVIAVHWLQMPGGNPQIGIADNPIDAVKAIGLKTPYYVCDAWIPVRPHVTSKNATDLMQKFADAMAQTIKTAR